MTNTTTDIKNFEPVEHQPMTNVLTFDNKECSLGEWPRGTDSIFQVIYRRLESCDSFLN